MSEQNERHLTTPLDNAPVIHFNNSASLSGAGEIVILLNRGGRTVAELHVPHISAKELSEDLAAAIVRAEKEYRYIIPKYRPRSASDEEAKP